MRWIFATLLVANLLSFLWAITFADGAPKHSSQGEVSKPFKYAGVKKIELIAEFDSIQAAEKQAADKPREVVKIEVEEPQPNGSSHDKKLCELIGPFADEEAAGDFVERLAAIDIDAVTGEVELPAGPGYWVYLVPTDSRKAALRLLSELHAKGVDSYVIPKGDLENGISLGMFSREELATKRVEDMEAIGLAPKLEVIERSYKEIWVTIPYSEAEKMSSLTWARAMEGTNELERRQNFCLDVASKDNFQ